MIGAEALVVVGEERRNSWATRSSSSSEHSSISGSLSRVTSGSLPSESELVKSSPMQGSNEGITEGGGEGWVVRCNDLGAGRSTASGGEIGEGVEKD